MIFIKANVSSDSITLLKLVKTDNSRETQLSQDDINKTRNQDKSLSLQGVSDQGYVLFKFLNKKDGVDQVFGVNLKKYLSAKTPEDVNVE
jgi:hypothetical protein